MRAIPFGILAAGMQARVLAVPESAGPSGVSIDSREGQSGTIFFAIRGERFDGHQYLGEVLATGAAAVVAEEEAFAGLPARDQLLERAAGNGQGVYLVRDSRQALGDAARAALDFWKPRVIAVTGSSGKTTTRRILQTLLDETWKIRTGVKNFNNEIGLPLTVFTLEDGDEILLLEMGMNHAGELKRLADIARPEIVVITNIGTAHIEHLGSRDGIAAAKKEALAFCTGESMAVLNSEDPYFDFLSTGVPGSIVPFGAVPEGFTLVRDNGLDGYVLGYAGGETVFALGGAHNLLDLSAGVALAHKLGLATSVLANRISLVRAVESRSQVVDGRVRVINDCYNANPESMRAGLNLLAAASGGRRVAVLADMLELGGDSARLHGELGEWIAASQGVDELVLLGPGMAECGRSALNAGFDPARLHAFLSRDELGGFLAGFAREGDTVLLKGSHGMQLESVLPVLSGE